VDEVTTVATLYPNPRRRTPLSRSTAVTRGIRVEVNAHYVPERSRPSESHWFFAYHIRISNEGSEPVQLVSRHWIITNANDEVEEVRGPGVVGQEPHLGPGEQFEYTSFCPLDTPFGSMRGTYQMVSGSGEQFDAEIATFALVEPFSVN
jgi:ApaG protein